MEWNFEPAESQKFIKVTAKGDFCSAEFGAILDELLSLPYWRSGTPLLFDYSGLRYAQIDAAELLAASEEVVRRGPHFVFTPVALVMGTPEDLEMGRRFGAITDHRVLARPRRFLSEANAVSWLKSSSLALMGFLESLPLAVSIFFAIAAPHWLLSRKLSGSEAVLGLPIHPALIPRFDSQQPEQAIEDRDKLGDLTETLEPIKLK